MAQIFHIALAPDWEAARAAGSYRTSTRGVTLEQQGFIHASTAEQVAGVANAFYRGAGELLLLVIDPERLTSELRYDPVPGADAPFPHVYGPLDLDAVVEVRPFAPGPEGTFSFP